MKISKEKLEMKLNILNQLNTSHFDSTDLAEYWFRKSVYHLFLEKDSSDYFLLRGLKYRKPFICSIVIRMENIYAKNALNNKLPPDFQTYFKSLPPNIRDSFEINCLKYSNLYRPILVNRDSSELAKLLMRNDQFERVKDTLNWEIQNKLDKRNRFYLDSIYSVHQSFKNFNEYELDAFSFVLHHSDDCEWNKKWFDIWIYEIKSNPSIKGRAFGPAVQRLLNPNNVNTNPNNKGCWERDPKGMRNYLDNLKLKYGQEIAIKFGYSDF